MAVPPTILNFVLRFNMAISNKKRLQVQDRFKTLFLDEMYTHKQSMGYVYKEFSRYSKEDLDSACTDYIDALAMTPEEVALQCAARYRDLIRRLVQLSKDSDYEMVVHKLSTRVIADYFDRFGPERGLRIGNGQDIDIALVIESLKKG
jgi:broad specificity phosphatase PhoE